MKKSIISRKQKSAEELNLAFNHLAYESEMLTHCYAYLKNLEEIINDKDSYQTFNNVFLESFLIHARVLIDFLFSKDRVNNNPDAVDIFEDDVIAEDFFVSYETWWKLCKKKSTWLKEVKPRTGKEVAHLTYDRNNKTDKQKEWDVKEIFNDIMSLLEIFIVNIEYAIDISRIKKLMKYVPTYKNNLVLHTHSPTTHITRFISPPSEIIWLDDDN